MNPDSVNEIGNGTGGIKILLKYFPALTEKQVHDFYELQKLYVYWNEKINIISRKDIEYIFLHHFLHSLSIAKLISFKPGTEIIDVGTGGGFPGIPLAVFFPEVEFLLVDSIGKKISVVNEIITSLHLKNVAAVKSRVEDLDVNCDFIVSRAVAPIGEMIKWTRDLISPGGNNILKNGWIFLKGGDLTGEIEESRQNVMSFEVNAFFDEEFFKGKKLIYISK